MIKNILFGALTTLMSIVFLEIGLQVFVVLRDYLNGNSVNPRLNLTPYGGQEWAESLFQEIKEVQQPDYVPYMEWKSKQYKGRYVNINEFGIRKTWNSISSGDTILVFGGSTTWGYGARDEYTIPSLISKRLHGLGVEVTVLNCGEQGYCFLQEINRLIIMLRQGYHPKLVIFYDGANDSFLADHFGTTEKNAFADQMDHLIKLKRLSLGSQIISIAKDWIAEQSKIYKAISKLLAFFDSDNNRKDDEAILTLVAKLNESYWKSYGLVERLSKSYGFNLFCFWQPVIFTKSHLSDEEKTVIQRAVHSAPDFQARINQCMVTDTTKNFFNISDVFDSESNTIFIDNIHISEEGNEIVAERIVKTIYKHVEHENGIGN